MNLKELYLFSKISKHPLHQLRKNYCFFIGNSLDNLNMILEEEYMLNQSQIIEVLSFLSSVKYRFQFWKYFVEDLKCQTFVPKRENKRKKLLEGPLSQIYNERSLYSLNYFLMNGANPYEEKKWGNLIDDISMDGYYGKWDYLYLSYLEDWQENKLEKANLNFKIVPYNLNENQLLLIEKIEKEFLPIFWSQYKNIFQNYRISELEEMSLSFTRTRFEYRIFIGEFLSWHKVDFNTFLDNIFEVCLINRYSNLFIKDLGIHHFKRNNFVSLFNLFYGNRKNYNRNEYNEILIEIENSLNQLNYHEKKDVLSLSIKIFEEFNDLYKK